MVNNNYRIRHDGKTWSLLAHYHENGPQEDKLVGCFQEDKLIGWVAHEDLISQNTPQKSMGIYQKVLLIEGDVRQNQQDDTVSIFHEPQLTGKSEKASIRTVFYVYQHFPATGTIADVESLLISPVRTLDPTKDNEEMITGWIDRKKVTFWNTRSAIELKPKRTYQLEMANGQILPLSLDHPLQHDELRFPILKSDNNSYTVGVFTTLSLADLVTKKRINKIKVGVEVMFVIDATRSMQTGIDAVLKATQQIANRLKSQSIDNGLRAPRFGVVFYRDKATTKPSKRYAYCSQEISMPQVLTEDINAFKNALKGQKACDADKTRPESMYNALTYSAQHAGWKKTQDGSPSGIRMIIHVGDAGDHGNGKSVSDVVEQFTQNHITVYTAVEVRDLGFTKSVKKITAQLSTANIKFEFVKTRHRTIVSKLIDTLTSGYKEAQKLKRQINILAQGYPGMPNRTARANYKPYQRYWEGTLKKQDGLEEQLLITKMDLDVLLPHLTAMINLSNDIGIRKQVWNAFLTLITGGSSCMDKETGRDLTAKQCNQMRNSMPIKIGFMDYTLKEFVNLNPRNMTKVICEAKVLRTMIREVIKEKRVVSTEWESKENCEFTLNTTRDLNGDGRVVKKGQGTTRYPE
ncbi:MAG: hypothetical protein KAH77_11085, partial [Thiomargarita sp.]|nr:hypothetical protein [Thiomargarita sp.]